MDSHYYKTVAGVQEMYMKSKDILSLSQSQDSIQFQPITSISIDEQIENSVNQHNNDEEMKMPETTEIAEQVLTKGPQNVLDNILNKDLQVMSLYQSQGFKRRSKSNQNLAISNPLLFKKEVDENSQEDRVRDEKSLEKERKKVNDRLENLYSQFRTRNMLLDETVLKTYNKATEKHIVAGATYKNTTHLQKETKINYADLAFLESKVLLKDP